MYLDLAKEDREVTRLEWMAVCGCAQTTGTDKSGLYRGLCFICESGIPWIVIGKDRQTGKLSRLTISVQFPSVLPHESHFVFFFID